MRHFFRGGRGMAVGQSDKDLSSRPKDRLLRLRLLADPRNDERSVNRNDETGRSDVARVIIIFCVLFSVSGLLGASAFAQPLHRAVPRINFGDQMPVGWEAGTQRQTERILRGEVRSAADGVTVNQVGINTGDEQQKTSLPYALQKRIRVGEVVPEELWNLPLEVLYHKDGAKRIRLADYRDTPLIIIDVWSTSCAVCIREMRHVRAVAEAMDGKMVPLFLTPQAKSDVERFMAGREGDTWETIVGANIFLKLFPTYSAPQEIWIKDGKVFAITEYVYVTKDIVKDVLDGRITELPEKAYNGDFEISKPLLVSDNGGNAADMIYHSLFTRYLDGIYDNSLRIGGEHGNKITLSNMSAYLMYLRFSELINPDLTATNRQLIQSNLIDSLKTLSAFYPEDRKHFFSYELLLPPSMQEQAPELMLADLNRFFGAWYGIRGEVAKIKRPCWVLRLNGSAIPYASTGAQQQAEVHDGVIDMRAYPLPSFVSAMKRHFSMLPLPIVDETDITERIDIQLFTKREDFEKQRKHLEKNGFELVKEDREIEMLVLSEIKTTKGDI
ncbi:TlpA family protein disulfide reductase [Sphingobacterium yanglingense]|uniref:Thioredoxin domain-containing protein n=1 Tax=Sphingobacterium yanglingense TaxID=1437280 RepID=A0A4R6WLJ5_9SPHI|nr:hypothetical protein [Sphingobacterium yanglingense]TDQ81701.1 hypothetical protein CLV99_0229 [Sphingobacterium yanglingense]